METFCKKNEGAEENVEVHHMVMRHKAKQMSITHTPLAAENFEHGTYHCETNPNKSTLV